MHLLKSKLLSLVALYVLIDRLLKWMLSFIPTSKGSYSDRIFFIRISSIRWFNKRRVYTCTAAVHIFQILYARQFFCHFLSRAFTPCVCTAGITFKQVIIKQKQKNINKIDTIKGLEKVG